MHKKTDKLKVFLSYSHTDSEWVERLLAHLDAADSRGLVEYWSDKKITKGSNWKKEIKCLIKEAKVFVMFISPEYIASPFCSNVESPLIKVAKKNSRLIIPILVKPVGLNTIKELSEYQFINNVALHSLPPRQQEQLIIEVAELINAQIIEHTKYTEISSSQVIASSIGGAIIGTMVLPVLGSLGGALLGGLLGGVVGSNASKGDRDDD
jgi:hypothetical protein